MSRPHRGLAVVRRSLPAVCQVCRDDRQVLSVRRGDDCGRMTRCPHCSPAAGTPAIPIFIYPMRDETPKGAA